MRSHLFRYAGAAILFIALLTVGPDVGAAQMLPDPLHAWISVRTPAALSEWVDHHLAAAQADIDRILVVKGQHTVANTLQPYDDAENEISIASNQARIFFSLAEKSEMRAAGQKESGKIDSAYTALATNASVYRALVAVPLPVHDPATRHYLERTLLEYRISGIDKDEATRGKIRSLEEQALALGLTFNKNIAEDVGKVSASPAELEGLPEDFIKRHKLQAEGSYLFTTDAPDYQPVMNFARNADLRRRMYLAYMQRAPGNDEVLRQMLVARQQLATLLGYKTYADLATADQMIGGAPRARQMLDDLEDAAREPAKREYAMVLEYAKAQQPGTTEITAADVLYWNQQVRKAQYSFDAQSVRAYLPYDRVESGVLNIASRLFHLRFQKVNDAVVWDPSVTVYDVLDNGRVIGRIYLDMHPRPGKAKGASSGPVLPGMRERQMPEGVLICNFSGGDPGDPGLMLHGEVRTFFHEFGHLMHHILGSQGRWSEQGGLEVERDFVEAPSQMLEEFMSDYSVLSTFAKHYQTGETIPAEVVKQMKHADSFGRAGSTSQQLFFANYALEIHSVPPSQINPAALWKKGEEHFEEPRFVAGDRGYQAFTQLSGYSSNYYTYVLDKIIAIDFFGQFDKADLLDGPTATRYRKTVLETGATKSANDIVKDFLGRPQSPDAVKRRMLEEFDSFQ